jgi:hypothetical protein
LLSKPLLRASGARSAFIFAAEWHVFVSSFTAVEVRSSGGTNYFVTDFPRVASIRLSHKTRRLIAIFRGDPADPLL